MSADFKNASYLDTAIAAAKLAGKILLTNINTIASEDITKKQEFDFVTRIDHLSEKSIVDYINNRHPSHEIFAEESGGQLSDAYIWIIDPLDGTKNYIHGFPVFSISIALMHARKTVAAVVYDPVRDECFTAERDKGAYINGRRLHVSSKNKLSDCLIGTGFPFRAKNLTMAYLESFRQIFAEVSDIRRAGSAALDLAYVACGRLDGFWEITLNLWDIAAGALLVTEAGGRITDLRGDEDAWQTGNIVVSNSRIHDRMTGIIAPAFNDLPV